MECTLCHSTQMQVVTVFCLAGSFYGESAVRCGNRTGIADLSAAFCVERCLIQNNYSRFTLRSSVYRFAVTENGNDLGIFFSGVAITGENRCRSIHLQTTFCPRRTCLIVVVLSCTVPLFFYQCSKAFTVYRYALLRSDFFRQVNGEAVGIRQLECIFAGNGILALCFQLCQNAGQHIEALVHSLGESLFFFLHDLADISFLFFQLRICGSIFVNNSFYHFIQERLLDADQSAVSCGTAEQAAKHVTTACVGRHYTVTDHECGAADMVGNHAESYISLFVCVIGNTGDAADVLHDILHGIYFEQVIYALHDTCQTFQTHTSIDVLVFHFGIVTVAVTVELAEYQIPYFYIAVAVAANVAVRLAAALFRSTVKVDLRTRTAGAGTVFPEVVFSAQTNHVVFCHADLLGPHVIGFVVIFENRNIQLICRHFQHLGEKFPCPCDCFDLEVIAEREVAQHLEIGAVTCGLTDTFNIRCTDTLLTGRHTGIRRNCLSQKIFFQRCHTGIDQQQSLIPLRYQRKAGQTGMSLALKKRQILFT